MISLVKVKILKSTVQMKLKMLIKYKQESRSKSDLRPDMKIDF